MSYIELYNLLENAMHPSFLWHNLILQIEENPTFIIILILETHFKIKLINAYFYFSIPSFKSVTWDLWSLCLSVLLVELLLDENFLLNSSFLSLAFISLCNLGICVYCIICVNLSNSSIYPTLTLGSYLSLDLIITFFNRLNGVLKEAL